MRGVILSASLRSYQPRNDANNKHTSTMQAATNGFTPSCEEIKSAQLLTFELPKNPRFINLTGIRFGMLLVIGFNGTKRNSSFDWKCVCDCGTKKVVSGNKLTCGRTKSCGCNRVEFFRAKRVIHGEARKTKEYQTWAAMRARCYNKNVRSYKDYGARGIKICERWQEYKNFLDDMGRCPASKNSIDRINPNGDYEPANCRWATTEEQTETRRESRIYELGGERHCIAGWARRANMPSHVLCSRLNKGWALEDAMSVPSYPRVIKITAEDAITIREQYGSGSWTYGALAEKYKITRSYARQIALGLVTLRARSFNQ
jgi:hypothetical protein